MIWFACNQCGKIHSRPENASGSMLFCTCGHGNSVPWESTAAPSVEAAPKLPPPLPPRLAPVRFEPPPVPPASGRSSRSRRRRYKPEKRDPNYCFNHEGVAKAGPCGDCKEGFCKQCLVAFGDGQLCGPCKNFRLRLAQKPLGTSNLAMLSLLLAIGVAGMFIFPLRPIALVFVLVLEGLALILAVMALRRTERETKMAGQGLAWTGLLTAAVVGMFTVLHLISLPRTMW